MNTAIIRLVSPTATDRFVVPAATIPLEAEVAAPETIHSVSYTVDGKWLALVETPPYRYTWANVPAGTYTLKATALSIGSLAAMGSDEMTVTVARTAAAWNTCPPDAHGTSTVQVRATVVEGGVRVDMTGPADAAAYEVLVADAVTGPWRAAATAPSRKAAWSAPREAASSSTARSRS